MIAQNQTVVLQEKTIHQQPITGISSSKQDENLFLTISEDQTMRLYDLRLSSSVRLFNMGKKSDSQTANCLLGESTVYGVRDDEIQLFDIRQEIIVKECTKKWKNDCEINQISFDPTQQLISANLDSGNTYIFDKELEIKSQLKGAHENICFSGDFIQKDDKQLYVSTGFDYKIVLWDYQDKEDAQVLFKFDLSKMHEFYAPLTVSPPVIYSAVSKEDSILISTETGQVYNFKANSLKRRKNKQDPAPDFVIDAHESKVMRSTYLNDKIVTVSNDMTFALWDKNKQNLRAKIKNKPNWIETIGKNTILVGDVSNKLSIFEIV